jgi:hypothetical protein
MILAGEKPENFLVRIAKGWITRMIIRARLDGEEDCG